MRSFANCFAHNNTKGYNRYTGYPYPLKLTDQNLYAPFAEEASHTYGGYLYDLPREEITLIVKGGKESHT